MSASMVLDFERTRTKFLNVIENSVKSGNIQECVTKIQEEDGGEGEKKLVTDQSLRDVIRKLVDSDAPCETFKLVIGCAVEGAIKDICTTTVPFLMLADMFDMLTLEKSERVFSIVEDNVSVWKSASFYDAGKNFLLRMCNDLIRRLSKSQNTVFCGRIQLFLSRLFPLSERSALNLMSQFNSENVTVFNMQANESKFKKPSEIKVEKMEMEEGEMEEPPSTFPIDYNLYRRFWSLQEYFRKPTQCYDKVSWKTFSIHADEVLKAFDSCKLDDLKSQRKKLDKTKQMDTQTFFAKYLTSEKLLDLQLSDSNFRRYVLVQFLILFQYLNAQVKFKSASHVLTDEQSAWVKTATEKVTNLIKETPPDGEKFAESVEHILEREENWNNWKNEGCVSYVREKLTDDKEPVEKTRVRAKRKRVGDDLMTSAGKINMGSSELTRLWNINSDNMDACKADTRVFLPHLEEYFAEAIEQADPEAQIEDTYKLVNKDSYQWRSLRLLARRSPHFFTQLNPPGIPLNKYLDIMVNKIAQDMPSNSGEGEMDGEGEEDEKNELDEEEPEEKIPRRHQITDNSKTINTVKDDAPLTDIVTKENIAKIAGLIGENWKMLGKELRMQEDDLAYFESEGETAPLNMLTVWKENETRDSKLDVIKSALIKIGQSSIADSVFTSS
ncbi:THO complex subunit 1 isoform X1 [Patella vulgata]|uniref:THO complex subunit 1 isoform X1 n=1 Tax=Patella vulgata TaxID=6465 RepID=UPI0024A847A8|nr:THO complex subunit 1 isoform X1 [Patella vulgata]